MKTDEVLEKLKPWQQKVQRAAWKPMTNDEDGPVAASKFAGTPWLAQDETWPACGNCHAPMPLLLQLNLNAFPTTAAKAYGSGLLQVFYCTECSDYEPFSPAHLVRIVTPHGEPQHALPQEVIDTFPPKTIVEWQEFVDSPDGEEHEELGLIYTYDWDAKPSLTRIECPELSLMIDDIEDENMAESISEAASGDKLGGWPNWVQGIEYPDCPTCQSRMGLLFQLDSEDNLPIMFGDVGTGHITQCPTHKEIVAFGWACS